MPAERTTSNSQQQHRRLAADGPLRSWLVCDICGESFKRTEHLTRHIRKHTGERPFQCPLCNKSFNRPDSLKRHELLHTTQKPPKQTTPSTEAHSQGHVNDVRPGLRGISDHSNAPSGQTLMDVNAPGLPDDGLADHVHDPEGLFPTQQQPQRANDASLPRSLSIGLGTSAGNHDLSYMIQQADVDPFSRALDPAVMSNTNWLPLAEMPDEWNPFNIFLDSPSLFESYATPRNPATTIFPATQSSPADSQMVIESPASTGQKSNAASDLDPRATTYVDSGVTRLPKGRKRATSIHSGPSPHVSTTGRRQYGFTSTPQNAEDESREEFVWKFLSTESYMLLADDFNKLCASTQGWFEPFASGSFLGHQAVDRFVDLAMEHFVPSLPFLNNYLVKRSSRTILLALATIGSRYTEKIDETVVYSLVEFLRRAVLMSGEAQSSLRLTELEFIQTKVLLCVSLLYDGRASYHDRGKTVLGDVTHFCRLQRDLDIPEPLLLESRIRTKHTIWALDCITAYQHDSRPLLSIEDADAPLPISDAIWESLNDTTDCSRLQIGQTPPLRLAIRDLYLEKKVSPLAGEFARVLLIHGLFHQTWHVAKTCRSPLSTWEPQAKSLSLSPAISEIGNDPDQWVPVNPTFARWRNAACDCIDVLHWHANSQIGANSGHEHPTVLFLHLSRVILLSPIERIREMVSALVGNQPLKRPQAESAVREIFRWAHEDCYKARLTLIHAGVLLYHVRRHSIDSFYEPNAVFSAILCLWAYGCAYQKSTAKGASRAVSPNNDGLGNAADEALPSFIHLDRPCDDELVQLFITNGNRISPNVTGVGDICAIGGPKKILKLGCSLLSFAKNWDLKQRHMCTLDRLQAKANVFESAIRQA